MLKVLAKYDIRVKFSPTKINFARVDSLAKKFHLNDELLLRELNFYIRL